MATLANNLGTRRTNNYDAYIRVKRLMYQT